MAISVVMPALEMAQETGKIISWIKKEGDAIAKGEPLLEIETDKIVVELEAAAEGFLAGVKSREGDVVPVGQIIAWIVAAGEQPPAESAADAAAQAMAQQARPGTATVEAPAAATPASVPATAVPAPKASPKAKRIAQERGVDLTKIRGTGPGGIISAEDVLAVVESPASAPAPAAIPSEPQELSAIARLMAERTTQSWTQVPHFFLVRDIDASALVHARESHHGVKLTITDFLIALVARTLTKHPKMNASWTGSTIRFHPSVNVTIAVAVKDGVVGAVIHDAAAKPLSAIAAERRDLADRAKSGRLRPADIANGTFTISNLGMYGVDAFSAIITPPQAAILAVGRIADRIVPVHGAHAIRPMMTITLSSDHRVVDGAQAALFLQDLAAALSDPQSALA
ncbi:MAG TPA: dihydrolipoamide acetyltransferase family protein [Bryobacteraceae bacterium]|nr:dihydrolipoamide acetyltransferase family protein [Bryobacteraceae bacterium]